MKLTIELDRETDGRWIAEIPELNILLYGDSKADAIQKVQSAAKQIVLDRINLGELPRFDVIESCNKTTDLISHSAFTTA